MKYPQFALENYLAAREFSAPYNLCGSDLESFPMQELLEMADPDCRRLWEQLALHYTEPKGHPLLLEEIRRLYDRSVHLLSFAGAEEGIYCAMDALLGPSDHAVVITPCYQSLESIPSALCNTSQVELRYEEGWSLDLGRVERAMRPNTKLLIINFPHNPTGALLTHQQQADLIALARRQGAWIFSDEVYRLLELNPADRLPPIVTEYERGISLGVMSKAYGLAGLRVGWIATQDRELLEEMGQMKHYLSICNSAPSEILALIALRASDRILERNRALMRDNLVQVDRLFEEFGDQVEWVAPKGGCIGFPRYTGGESADWLADRLYEEYGVLILPGSVYGHQGDHFRLSFGRKVTVQAIDLLRHFLEGQR